MPMTDLKTIADQASGRAPADLVVKNVGILDIRTGRVKTGDIAVCGRIIAGIYDSYQGKTEIDGSGMIAVPGFIDLHLHVESSLVAPYEFERMVLPKGTTTALCDPHEMANVIGTKAFDYFLQSAAGMVMDLKVGLSSCVPATPIGTSGATVTAEDMEPYVARAHSLAEVMNIVAAIEGQPDMMKKLGFFKGRHVDGHMPGLGLDASHGRMINALAALNIKTDHECTTMKEALEKSERGIRILIREGTGCKNLEALMPFITTENSWTNGFCTDDFHPADIVKNGHMDFIIRKAIRLYDPNLHGPDKARHVLNVYRMATFAAAQVGQFNQGLNRRGELVPGALADIVLVKDLEACDVQKVIKAGQPVEARLFEARPPVKPAGLNSVMLKNIVPDDFRLKADKADVTVIEVIPDNVLTNAIETTLPLQNGEMQPDPARDILKAACLERHGRNGNIGIGFVKGFQFANGAIASTVGHDDHNITVVGCSDEEMALAANTLKTMGGGYVVVEGDRVLASLPLPLAGLMSDKSFEETARQEEAIRAATKQLLKPSANGLPQPLISLAFISLSVIPDARLCDAGITRNDGTGPKLVWDQRRKSGPKL
jgi:adenine deaminase